MQRLYRTIGFVETRQSISLREVIFKIWAREKWWRPHWKETGTIAHIFNMASKLYGHATSKVRTVSTLLNHQNDRSVV